MTLPTAPAVRRTLVIAAAALVLGLSVAVVPASAAAGAVSTGAGARPTASGSWVWPLAGPTVVRAYQAPAHEYGPGHRGVDVRGTSERVRAPRAGVVAFAGRVADRGVITIDHGDGYVTTLEPVRSSLTAGMRVTRGETVGAVAAGGHTAPGALHFGVRDDGAYVNPQLLFGEIPRAVLLPCCS